MTPKCLRGDDQSYFLYAILQNQMKFFLLRVRPASTFERNFVVAGSHNSVVSVRSSAVASQISMNGLPPFLLIDCVAFVPDYRLILLKKKPNFRRHDLSVAFDLRMVQICNASRPRTRDIVRIVSGVSQSLNTVRVSHLVPLAGKLESTKWNAVAWEQQKIRLYPPCSNQSTNRIRLCSPCSTRSSGQIRAGS